jgi:hypothetical protein
LNDSVAINRRKWFLLQHQKEVPKEKEGIIKNSVISLLKLAGVKRYFSKQQILEINVNKLLKKRKVIFNRLSIQEIWAVTDIQVPGQPGSIGQGISLDQLKGWLPNFDQSAYTTYNFFNTNLIDLPGNFLVMENKYLSEDDRHGFLFASLFENK